MESQDKDNVAQIKTLRKEVQSLFAEVNALRNNVNNNNKILASFKEKVPQKLEEIKERLERCEFYKEAEEKAEKEFYILSH